MRAPDWLTARPIAHRALHDRADGRIENSLSAVRAAIDKNYAIEVDLQLTSDESVIVFHDDALGRPTGSDGLVRETSLSVIRSLRLIGSNDQIPTLHELLETVAGRTPLVLELKSNWQGDRRLEEQVAAALEGYGGPVAVMSFDPASVQAMRKHAPHLPRGLVADRFKQDDWPEIPAQYRLALRHLIAVTYTSPHFIAYDVKALPANGPLLARHALGLPLLTWTVRTPGDVTAAGRWADQMIFEGFDPDTC